jgi:Dihydroorotase and related cyclic amidohydrolases
MIDLIIKNAKAATASDIFNCDIGIDKEKIVFLEKNSSKEAKQIIDAKNQYVLLRWRRWPLPFRPTY